jgi:serine/threonine-protein kinase
MPVCGVEAGVSFEIGEVVGGKYRLERPIARGGMGNVWAARHLTLDTPIALKFMDPALAGTASARSRFDREAKAAATIKSAHVVQILDHGVDEDLPFIAMELLEGEDLGGRLQRVYRMSLAEASTLLTQVARGLERAHALGIIHRDIKPRNLFLSKTPDGEIVKILDFGVAKVQTLGSGDTATGELVGSPHFMSPEQAHGARHVDHRTDLWSLGVILFRALTGERPFRGEGMGDVLVQIVRDEAPAPSSVAKDLPPEVDAFFKTALARDPAKRFSSARAMADAFAEIAGGAPLSTTRPGKTASAPSIPAPQAVPPAQPLFADSTSGHDTSPPEIFEATPPTQLIPSESVTEAAHAADASELMSRPTVDPTLAGTNSRVPPPMTSRGSSRPIFFGAAMVALIVAAFFAGRARNTGTSNASDTDRERSAAATNGNNKPTDATPASATKPVEAPSSEATAVVAPTAAPSASVSSKPPKKVVAAAPTETPPAAPPRPPSTAPTPAPKSSRPALGY